MNRIISFLAKLSPLRKRQGTVRFMFPAVISFAALLGAAVITADDVSYVRLESSQTTVEAGERFSFDVYAYAHVPVNAVDITIAFDQTAVEVISVDKGQSVLTIWTVEPIIENDFVILRGGTFRKGFITEHKIATINLKAKTAGPSIVRTSDVMLLAGDGAGTAVAMAESQDANLSFYIYDEDTDPGSIGVALDVSIITDINGDGRVTLQDISVFMSAWNTKNKIFDFNGDGRMTFRDFSIILADFFFK